MAQQHIDRLLERYLTLLDEYTQLRESLSRLQSGVYQNIARANFSGERGMRYGQDHYDERMQALRVLEIGVDGEGVARFTVSEAGKEDAEASKEEAEVSEDKENAVEEKGGVEDVHEAEEKDAQRTKKKKVKNPLHWFGLFAPMPLRTAQTQSIQGVEDIIPRLVSVNAEMLHVEIEVRRAKKRRAKAEAADITAKKDTETAAEKHTSTVNKTPVQAV